MSGTPIVVLVLAALVLLASAQLVPAPAQDGAPVSPPAPVPTGDGSSPQALVAATYDVISGGAGSARDWVRFHALFHPERGRLMASRPRRGEGAGPSRELVHLSPREYQERSGPVLEQRGFFERQVAARVEQFGDIAHVFSTYESRSTPDSEPFARGINSFQLWFDGERWWVLSILWCEESQAMPIPERYLTSPRD
jgi:hypothetical protein